MTLKQSIEQLIAAYESEKAERTRLAAELESALSRNQACTEQIAELERQIDNLKLKGAFTAEGDNTQAHKKINRLIKEIDRCISLMEG